MQVGTARIRARLGLLTLATAGAALTTVPADAFHEPELPVLSKHQQVGNAWTTYRVYIPDETSIIDIEVLHEGEEGTSFGEGFWLLDSAGKELNYAYGVGGWSTHGYYAKFPAPVGVVADRREHLSGGVGGGFAVGFSEIPEGEYVFVALGASDAASSHTAFGLYGTEGVALLNKTSGSGGFVLNEWDFDTATHVAAPGAQLIAQGTLTRTETGSLFGFFASFSSVAALTYDGPDHSRRSINGEVVRGEIVISGTPPGEHTFTALADVGGGFAFWLWGAAVTELA